MDDLLPQDYWRAVVLYGQNVATYKIALSNCLLDFAREGQTDVSMHELARAFFRQYRERLVGGMPQLSNPGQRTVLERVVEAYNRGEVSEDAAVDRVEKQGFTDVVPRFHTVNGAPIPRPFYEATPRGLILTDDLLALFVDEQPMLRAEIASRWDLLEAAFEMRLPIEVLGTDAHMIFRSNGYERVNITGTHPVLNGYQNGLCFYCGEPLGDEPIHVDHLIARGFLNHDEIWNLVLAHAACNLSKSDLLPPREYLEKLYRRNEYFIASNHPIKRHLIAQMGATPAQRRGFLEGTYADARRVLIHIWSGFRLGARRADPLAPLHLTAGS